MKHTQLASITQLTAAIALAMTMFGCGGSGPGVSAAPSASAADSRGSTTRPPEGVGFEDPVAAEDGETTGMLNTNKADRQAEAVDESEDSATRSSGPFRLISMKPAPQWNAIVKYSAQVTLNGRPAPKGVLIHIRYYGALGQVWTRTGRKTDEEGRIYWKGTVPQNNNNWCKFYDLKLTVAETGQSQTIRLL